MVTLGPDVIVIVIVIVIWLHVHGHMGPDVTKFKTLQNTNFGQGRPAFGQRYKGHIECKINLARS